MTKEEKKAAIDRKAKLMYERESRNGFGVISCSLTIRKEEQVVPKERLNLDTRSL